MDLGILVGIDCTGEDFMGSACLHGGFGINGLGLAYVILDERD